jgi:translation initiation factor IF-3
MNFRHNHLIRGVNEVNVIDAEGKLVGLLEVRQAISMAQEQGLDLVEVNRNSAPPTCKIMNFGQFKYEQKKKMKSRPVQQEILKESTLSVGISEHDLGIKCKQIQGWLNEKYKVLVKLKFMGREITHPELGFEKLNQALDMLEPSTFAPEAKPSLQAKVISVVLKPSK